ncbi:hypothetical protein HDU98_000526 [Podochytrium sp. JEL0797]|nr:hypothetical protein HDU98_000526 [Podochytrium sp. JEL0797]
MASTLIYLLDPRLDEFDDTTLVTSAHVSPRVLLGVRIVMLCYALVTLGATIDGSLFYGYFTDWTMLGINMYLISAIINGIIYIANPTNITKFKARPILVRYINWVLYLIPATCAYIVSIIFWSLVFATVDHSTNYLLWKLCSQHAGNSIIMLTELFLGRVPLAYALLPPFLTVSLAYVCITEIFHLETGIWAYDFLNTSAPFAWAYYVGATVFFILVFFIVTAIHIARDKRRVRLGLVSAPVPVFDRSGSVLEEGGGKHEEQV